MRCNICPSYDPSDLKPYAVPGFSPAKCKQCPKCGKIFVWVRELGEREYGWEEYYSYVQNKNKQSAKDLVITHMARTTKKPKTKKRPKVKINQAIEILKKRLVEVGVIRDRISNDISDLDSLHDDCIEAYENIETAIYALSRLA